jgi:Kef-type K+ transport system membrane component KefB
MYYITIISAILTFVSTGIAALLAGMLKKTNTVIEANTAVNLKLEIAIVTLQEKNKGDDQLCNERHIGIGRTLTRHESVLKEHSELLQKHTEEIASLKQK